MKCYLENLAAKKLRFFINNIDAEISGWGKTEMREGDIYVLDLVIFKQTVSGSRTELDYDTRAKFGMELKKSGEKQEDWNLWWHSHNSMKTFWSTTDETAIKNEMGKLPYLLSIVSNNEGDLLTRIDITLKNDSPFKTEDVHYETIDKIETLFSPVLLDTENYNAYQILDKEKDELLKTIELSTNNITLINTELERITSSADDDPKLEKECKKEIKNKVSESTYSIVKKDIKDYGKFNSLFNDNIKSKDSLDGYADKYNPNYIESSFAKEDGEDEREEDEEYVSNDEMKFKCETIRDVYSYDQTLLNILDYNIQAKIDKAIKNHKK